MELHATFLALVHPSSWGGNLSESVHGAVFRMGSDAASVAVHNNPTAQVAVRGQGISVAFGLAAGVAAGNVTRNRTVRLDAAGGAHRHIVVAGNGSLVAVDAESLEAQLADGAVLFLAHPGNTASAAALHDRLDALASGALGGEATVVEGEGEPVQEGESFGVAMRAEHAGQGSVRVRASSDEPRGRAVIVRTDTDTVPAGSPEEVRVLLDGVALERAASAKEALTAAEGQGRAHIEFEAGGIQVIVTIPSFSDHTTEVQSAAEEPPPPEEEPARVPGAPAVAAMLLAGLAALVAARRRRS